jgi:hypothetical protein
MLGSVAGTLLSIRLLRTSLSGSRNHPAIRDESNCHFIGIKNKLVAAGAPEDFAYRVYRAVDDNWHSWSDNYKCVVKAYPTFENCSGDDYSQAPMTRNVPFALAAGVSIGLPNMLNPSAMAESIRLGLDKRIHEPAALKATTEFANWLCKRFREWYEYVIVTDIWASGTVFKLSYVPGAGGKVAGEAKSKFRFLNGYPF